MSHAEADDLYGDGGETGHTFLFTLNDDYIIDANRKGNSARWINHSCAPNCRAVVEESADGNPRHDKVMIEAIRAIKPGEELTYDYGITLEVPHTARLKKLWKCLCGAPDCTGTLLKPKR
ncbi:myeloid/lymphoid or mixed-lineage leukemia protein 3 [Dorcoceras hygrometricum]|uniref:Myeloid/lymphoid or mixed-lineage leukemia protein 3 n=1 Tax=Dorcoceras hygrometricum TaxID=472368 RepID=A0A2Z7A8T9_9LAMI|nr:myeloid/lymphoid or mixed-lineage leukemia protein 3 [Dorcoceras hygrometricum]